MINRLRKALQLPSANGISGGFIIDAVTERIKASVKSSENYARYVRAEALVNVDGAFTILPSDDGKHFLAIGDSIGTLPAASSATKGMKVRLTVGALAGAGAGHALSPNAADAIYGNGFAIADDKDAICSIGTDRVGDTIELECDGVNGWIITSVVGTWARE